MDPVGAERQEHALLALDRNAEARVCPLPATAVEDQRPAAMRLAAPSSRIAASIALAISRFAGYGKP